MPTFRSTHATPLDLWCLADPLVLDDPLRPLPGDRDHVLPEPPSGWRATARREWVHVRPVGVPGPWQGWKVHVAAVPDDADEVLATIARWAYAEELPFKYLRSRRILSVSGSKYAPRASSGKFVTAYPADEDQLRRVLEELDPLLTAGRAPYVLSDLRYREGPLHVRFGAFRSRDIVEVDGSSVPAVLSPTGLVPDERLPWFSVPAWAPVPAVVQEMLDQREREAVASHDLEFVEALHFSNGGGVYRARRTADDLTVLVKEARPWAGLDGHDQDAVARLGAEHEALVALGHVAGLPRALDRFRLWEHEYLVTDFVEGETAQRWAAAAHPLSTGGDDQEARDRYADRVAVVLEQVARIVRDVHAAGWVHGDVHPANLLVSDGDVVTLVDLELARPLTSTHRAGLGCPGFVRPGRAGRPLTRDDDEYALAALALWFFHPSTQVLDRDPQEAGALVRWIADRFPVGEEWLALVRAAFGDDIDTMPRRRAPFTRQGLVAGILGSASADRDDRLFPGDLLQFAQDGVGVAVGAAGVLWSLAQQGVDPTPGHVEWLVERATVPTGPGLLDGRAGVGTVLLELGHGAGADLVRQAGADVLGGRDATLTSGRAGAGLALLALGGPDDVATAVTLAEGLEDLWVPSADTATGEAAGLIDGWSGPALFLATLGRELGDDSFTERAVGLLRRDLRACTTSASGALLVDEGGILYPYLSNGTAGVAVVASVLASCGADGVDADEARALATALSATIVAEPGLYRGRAGLLVGLAALRAAGLVDTTAAIAQHVALLDLQMVEVPHGLSCLGRGQRRASTDLATGSAGVLSALAAVDDPARPFLPLLSVGGPSRPPRHRPLLEKAASS